MKPIAIIPARYASTRFPGKPLAMLGDKPVIQWVYEAASAVFDHVAVATDDPRIAATVEQFGGMAVMTSTTHQSGTSRVCEAYHLLDTDADVIVNLQGDEPFIEPMSLNALVTAMTDDVDIATLITRYPAETTFEQLNDLNAVKVVTDGNGDAMLFSRSVIPYVRGCDPQTWAARTTFYRHLGVYAFRASVIDKLVTLPPTILEQAESLEQLRWLQHGYHIRTALTQSQSIGIDTPADLAAATALINNHSIL